MSAALNGRTAGVQQLTSNELKSEQKKLWQEMHQQILPLIKDAQDSIRSLRDCRNTTNANILADSNV